MMIDIGEAQVFEWEMAQLLQRVVGRELAPTHIGEELFEGVRIHVGAAFRCSPFAGRCPDDSGEERIELHATLSGRGRAARCARRKYSFAASSVSGRQKSERNVRLPTRAAT